MKHIFLLCALAILVACEDKKEPKVPVLPTDDLKGSVHAFMGEYAHLISTGNFDSIPLLYDTLGAIMIGHNQMAFEPMDSIIARYRSYPHMQVNFRWDSMDVQILDSTVALVTSLFYANQVQQKDTSKGYYTGVLVKQRGKWKIKHEHESFDTGSKPKRES